MKRNINKLKMLAIAFFLVGSIVNGVVITFYNVDKSSNIGEIVSQIDELSAECNEFTEKVSAADSLSGFLENSKIFGYGESSRILYFNQPGSVAQVR